METSPSRSASSGASDQKIKFSQSELQSLIQQEVCIAVHKNESKLQGLMDAVQQLDRGVDCESTIQRLEARINMIAKRAEAALAFMTKKEEKSRLPSHDNVDITRSDGEDETMETVSQNANSMEYLNKSGELFQMMKTSEEALKKIQADNKALTAAIANLSKELHPSVPSPHDHCSPDHQGLLVVKKNELEDQQEKEKVEESKQVEEPKAARVKAECPSPDHSDSPKHTDSTQGNKLSYPPLPSTTFPSVLSMEAASYNIPERLDIHLAFIRNTASLSVLWNVEVKDPYGPPMDSYSIFMTTEKVKGSGVFCDWDALGEVKAKPLPLCMMINKYKPGHKVCVAVVGKDKFGRYGPYSKVVTAAIPD